MSILFDAGNTGSCLNAEMPMDGAQIEIERRQYHLRNCLNTLVQAQRIRQDADLMRELRDFIRKGRDELTTLVDEIGS